ncbi:hypothetical protein QUB05_24485 [Microcoleus sp. F10-C6]
MKIERCKAFSIAAGCRSQGSCWFGNARGDRLTNKNRQINLN